MTIKNRVGTLTHLIHSELGNEKNIHSAIEFFKEEYPQPSSNALDILMQKNNQNESSVPRL